MPVFRSDKARGVARNVKAFLSPKPGVAPPQSQEQSEPEVDRQAEIASKKRELRQITTELRAAKKRGDRSVRFEQMKLAKSKQREIYQLEREPDADANEPGTGALPDFAVIGGAKCGTTFFYHLLTLHPQVEPTAMKETHFFDRLFDQGVEWYRGCFPKPRLKNGRMTITGDGTPGYLFNPVVPERMAGVIPEARLISVIRNPVERAYSAYHHRVRNGSEKRTFEEAVEKALKREESNPTPEERVAWEREEVILDKDIPYGFVSNGVYVDHLLHWARFFPRERMLVVKSEDFFADPTLGLRPVLDYLGLPAWEPDTSELPEKRKNTGGYEQRMDPAIRQQLEDFYRPHNQRLYDWLGVDFGW